ncbi:Protein CBG08003 [Caenorhabditis briggsae]|uniref:Protein CBG08003 n=2 Tax=Caenorhabditis briggsae TaxID=6238 RepID=A8X5K0_CAEBR|nr:Protein CBG08003 [Caenorhabditis briggsae]ULU14178.1 hypothetical protein L3Y34_016597 [Caenorhabditis briggsae]CAP27911.1 Protein CBG08003 [Caenorhabditis briggsae]
MKFLILIIFCFVCPILAAIGRYDGGRDSSSWSSESSEGHGHGHGGRPRPPRPPVRPRPPREKTNCPTDWMLFKRTQGNWCVRVFVGRFNHPQSEAQCVAQGAKLTGLQTNEERLKVADAGLKLIHQNGFQQASLWLGAKRKASCPRAGICAPIDTFEWTDGQTTGTDGFNWFSHPGDVQPDGKWRNDWGHQSCALQFLFASGTTSNAWRGFVHGQMDDQWCQYLDNNSRLYACGKLAT